MSHYIDCFPGLAEFNDDWLCCVVYVALFGETTLESRSWLCIYDLEAL